MNITPLAQRLGCTIVVVLLSTSAAAQQAVFSCTGTKAVHYSPGLTFTPQLVTFSTSTLAAPCVGTPSVGSLTVSSSGTDIRSCSVLPDLGVEPVSTIFHWGDGTQSVVEERGSLVERLLGTSVFVMEMEVVSGRFTGGTVLQEFTLLNTDLLACLTPQGVTDIAGPVLIEVIAPTP